METAETVALVFAGTLSTVIVLGVFSFVAIVWFWEP